MVKEHYSDAVNCALSEYITPAKFRTVLFEQHKQPGGITEVPVEITLSKETVKKLSFRVSGDGMLYGFARIKPLIREKFGAEAVKIYLTDWEVKYILVFEMENEKEKAFYIKQEEVIELLENCCRVPQQQSLK